MRTLSPTSYRRCVLENTSDCLLSGLGCALLFLKPALGVFGLEPDATDGGLEMDDPYDTFLVFVEYRDGSLNLMASAKDVSKMEVSAE